MQNTKNVMDYYDYVLESIYNLYLLLCGGHYEPKSERDRQLANYLEEFLILHKKITLH